MSHNEVFVLVLVGISFLVGFALGKTEGIKHTIGVLDSIMSMEDFEKLGKNLSRKINESE